MGTMPSVALLAPPNPQALYLSPQTSLPPTRLREVAFLWESLPTPTSPQQVHVFGFLPSFLCQGSSPLLTRLFSHFFFIYLLIPCVFQIL